jgi:hypothetical protein
MKKLLLRAIVIIIGVVIGSAAGGYLTFHRYTRDYAIVRAFAWIGMYSAVSENQYDKNSSDARGELLFSLSFWTQGVESSALDPTMKNALRMSRGLTEARLSVLENEAGNANQAKSHLLKAQEDLKAVGWVDLSEASILQAIKRQPLSPCDTTSQPVTKTSASAPQKPCS